MNPTSFSPCYANQESEQVESDAAKPHRSITKLFTKLNIGLTVLLFIVAASGAIGQCQQYTFERNQREVETMNTFHDIWHSEFSPAIRNQVMRLIALCPYWTNPAKTFNLLANEYDVNKVSVIKSDPDIMNLIRPNLELANGTKSDEAPDWKIIAAAENYRSSAIICLNTMEQITKCTMQYPTTSHSEAIFNEQYRGIFEKLTSSLGGFIDAYRNLNPRKPPAVDAWKELTDALH